MRRSTGTALPTADGAHASNTAASGVPAAAPMTTTSHIPPTSSSSSSRKVRKKETPTSSSLYYYTIVPVCICILIVILDFIYLEAHHKETSNSNNGKSSIMSPATVVKSKSLSLPTLLKSPMEQIQEAQKDESQVLSSALVEINAEEQISSPNTIVTAYFQIRSKYPKETYMEWMSVMLSVQDAMVVFTTEDWVEPIMSLRQHAKNRTHVVILPLDTIPMATEYSPEYWEAQLHMDPERKRHAGYQVFWIWLSKTYFVTEAIRLNPYGSEFFMWSDIGCFRGKAAGRYRDKLLIQHPNVVPKDRILFLSHNEVISPPESLWWNDKLRQKSHFYHSGSQMAGYVDVWAKYHAAFMETFQGFNDRRMFIGDDQPVFQCACLQHPSLCAYVPRDQVKDNHYFGLRYVLHHGGKYTYWFPPNVTAGQLGK